MSQGKLLVRTLPRLYLAVNQQRNTSFHFGHVSAGFENNEAYKTLDELQQFAIDDWALLHGKFTRCQGSVKRCCDNHGEALRKSRFLDALTAHRTAHTHAFEQYLERYQRSLRKLDNLRSGLPIVAVVCRGSFARSPQMNQIFITTDA